MQEKEILTQSKRLFSATATRYAIRFPKTKAFYFNYFKEEMKKQGFVISDLSVSLKTAASHRSRLQQAAPFGMISSSSIIFPIIRSSIIPFKTWKLCKKECALAHSRLRRGCLSNHLSLRRVRILAERAFYCHETIAPGNREPKSSAAGGILYPSATSSTIISTNPTANPTVPRFECSPSEASGISSSTTT